MVINPNVNNYSLKLLPLDGGWVGVIDRFISLPRPLPVEECFIPLSYSLFSPDSSPGVCNGVSRMQLIWR